MKRRSSANGISIQVLCYDILIQIFMKLNVDELSIASMVCKSWNQICRDPLLWAKIDLSRLNPNIFSNIPILQGTWREDTNSRYKLMKFLNYALSLSNYNTNCLKLNFFAYLSDAQLTYVAERDCDTKSKAVSTSS
ncbi:F-box/LRR-repeat protein At3g48880-like [Vicia villosa]|uniref:F-box/LRR-repeat protein At3g48880-like n=1 Tax=Vicia villosa TaxID=3911 RepID=UPI00273ADF4B|nr:F-box/LRR-repeat protein At3g48880-like [Vicia villosa]